MAPTVFQNFSKYQKQRKDLKFASVILSISGSGKQHFVIRLFLELSNQYQTLKQLQLNNEQHLENRLN